jgi:hypothetical protein
LIHVWRGVIIEEMETNLVKRVLCVLSLVLAFGVSRAVAQKVYTPEKGSAERAAIMDALRGPVSKELKQKVAFLTDSSFKVQGDWAFIGGQVRGEQGGDVNWKITEYQQRIDVDAFDNNIFALLRKRNGKWRVVTYLIGCTDVCYLTWPKEYRAPKAIFK